MCIRVSNGLDPDPYLGLSCLQRLSADVKVPASKEHEERVETKNYSRQHLFGHLAPSDMHLLKY